MNRDTLSIFTDPTAAPKSKKTRASLAPAFAIKVTEYVCLVVVIFTSSVTFVHGSALRPIPGKIGLSVSDHASKDNV